MNKWIDGLGRSLWAWVMLLVMASCTDDNTEFGEYRPSEVIAFTASLEADVQAVVGRGVSANLGIEEEVWPLEGVETVKDSRGKVVSSLNGLNVGVFGYADNSLVMSNKHFTFVDKENLLPNDTPIPWSSNSVKDKNLKFFSYAPRLDSGITDVDGTPTLIYTVPTNVANQKDIIASEVKEVPANYNQYIPLTFNHVLTGIRFKTGFTCKVTSLAVVGVYGKGTYSLGGAWSNQNTPTNFTLITGGTTKYNAGNMLTDGENTLMMIPQLLPEGAKVVLTYEGGSVEAPLTGLKWEPGKLITYTINQTSTQPDYIYFDLYAGNVEIKPTSYTGKVLVNGVATEVSATSVDVSTKKFYVYQSTEANKNSTGWETAVGTGTCRIPSYKPVMVGNQFWSEFITNNDNVESVIDTWDTKNDHDVDNSGTGTYGKVGVVRKVGRTSTPHWINVKGDGTNVLKCELNIDNIYSRYQIHGATRTSGGITYTPDIDRSELTINLLGDNRVGNVHYYSGRNTNGNLLYNNKLIFQGTGSLTAACVDFHKGISGQSSGADYNADNVYGYFSNYWCSAIGGDDGSHGNSIGIFINGGTIYAGTTQAENCTALGAGGNDKGYVTIEGGTVTAVATTTGTAIGGGIGFNSTGGYGNVKITGGNVYAYNHANEWEIPSAAIGSAGSWASVGGSGVVEITGGYVYAQTALGTAIGGGSSKNQHGGNATINISGNCYVIAKSIAAIDKKTSVLYPAGNGIGGGTGGVSHADDSHKDIPAYGGSATVNISGNPTIRTGSIGGGKTNNPKGKIGSATITVNGGDISAQFVMAGGAGEGQTSSFNMTGGIISNSDVKDKEYYHVQQEYGGAVYMEDGIFTMSGGTIQNCAAKTGGAVYIKKSANALQNPTFTMSGGTIQDCMSDEHGGGVYLEVGEVSLSGNATIQRNLAQKGNGGAVYITAGNFSMSGEATVTYNSALGKKDESVGNGGGIYVTSTETAVDVDVLSGIIQYNTSDGNGGGICVDMAGVDVAANIKIAESGSTSMDNPDIRFNESVMYGGGLYASGVNAKIDINGGVIMDNKVSNYVPNENVSNEGGTVTLNGGNVTHVVVTFDANAPDDDTALLDGAKTAEQKIVTNTNSFLVQPTSINRSLYNFDGWNTRPDGNGTVYSNGDVMNLKENLTLYAQWVSQ